MSKKVCLFGTSANPPTGKGGHGGIVEHLLSLTSRDGAPAFDEVRVLPVYRHMFDVSGMYVSACILMTIKLE